MKSGQILVLVLLLVVVVLAVGLSVASRNLTNLRTSAQAEQSQRAFTAAEGGVEDVLSKLNSVANVIQTNNSANGCSRDAGSTDTATCSLPGQSTDTTLVGDVKVKATKGYQRTIEPGDVAQINLDTYVNSAVDIYWVKNLGDPRPLTLELIFVCKGTTGDCMGDALSGGYGQHREIFRASDTTNANEPGSGVASCPSLSGATTDGFLCGKSFSIPTTGNVKMLRVKSFWNRTTVVVKPTGANASTFPVQTYEITSTATTDTGVSRKVEVRREALPQLPALFDYALYSGGNITK